MSITYEQLKAFTRWVKVTVNYTDLARNALTNTIPLYTMGEGEQVIGVRMFVKKEFVGGAIASYTISVDQLATGDLLGASSVFTVPATLFASAPLVPDAYPTSTSLTVTGVSIGANLDQATQGQVFIWLLVSTLPA